MLVSLIKDNCIINFTLPKKVLGSYWLTDKVAGEERNIINIESQNGSWILQSNFETKIITQNKIIDKLILNKHNFYTLKVNGEKNNYYLYCTDAYDDTYRIYNVNVSELIIGSDNDSHIKYNASFINPKCAKIKYENNFIIESIDNYPIFINGKKVNYSKVNNGDIIFIMGLKIIALGKNLVINNIENQVQIKNEALTLTEITNSKYLNENTKSPDDEVVLYNEQDYFYRAPRFVTSIEKENITFDSPPEAETNKERPLIYTIGPMLTMAVSSSVYSVVALSNVINKKASLSSSLPTLVISMAMLMTILLWPSLLRKYDKKEKIKREKIRQQKYSQYLEDKKIKIETLKKQQGQILMENNLGLKECQNIILNKKRNLWERKVEHDDFLSIRLGLGTAPLAVDLNYPSDHFSLNNDNLKEIMQKIVSEAYEISNVPICLSLTNKNNVVIVGDSDLKKIFLNNLILNIITFHSYEDVKLVFLLDNDDDEYYKNFKILPYCWDNMKEIRFFAENYDEASKLSFYLEQIFSLRKYSDSDKTTLSDITYKNVSPYYVIITNSIKKMRNLEIINQVLSEKRNLGFSVVIINNGLFNLPNECSNFIVLDENKSAIIESDLNTNKQKTFILDQEFDINMYELCKCVANIPIKFSKQENILTNSLGFLEMYNVGKVEQLNALGNWNNNSPIHSLACPIGVSKDNEILSLDLHEKFHGPHGLIAGMTGSGKSELIITYILSMAINYSPKEVSFVLIDYKGGGLTGAFENSENGYKLPHIVGSITNLDTNELKRSFASIQSELRRRQIIFNEVKHQLNESTIDIYKYQKAYRDGKVSEAISHLFIICDEFAELKMQQPDFMEQLISIARIGRSLGVHLILATQKPSGIVDDQIWSNSRFRISLKVQEKSDSMDVIKRPDAASLKTAGRFYLQVGYNDLFALGQSAFSGFKYYPAEKLKKKVDHSLSFISNIGNVIKSIDDNKQNVIIPEGEELSCIVKYLYNVSKEEGITLKQLWLDKIPAIIYINDLTNKYNYKSQPFNIKPIIGEYDDPDNQSQNLLVLNLTEKGNTLIFGDYDNGETLLLTTIIYSTILDHNADEVNFYILDFGSETLKCFKDAPQVGDVIFSIDKEKVINLFKTLADEIEKRKTLFVNYNGNYQQYCAYSGKSLPLIIVIINNYENFSENYDEYQDSLVALTRDGMKYGIVFIITANNSNSIRYRLAQNFKENIALNLNDHADYLSIFGNVNNVYPSKIMGRGIISIEEKVYEFQTAYPYEWNNLTEYIKIICKKLSQFGQEKAKEVAILPNIVNEKLLIDYYGNLQKVPIGIEKNTLKPCLYNFKEQYMNVITSEQININFTHSFVKLLTKISGLVIMIIDAEDILKQVKQANVIYYNNNFAEVVNQISRAINNLLVYKANKKEIANQFLCIIVGINKFREKLELKTKEIFDDALIKGRELNNFRFVIIETTTNLKKIEYEKFYLELVRKDQGIFLGDGITNQFVLKVNYTTKEMTKEIGDYFGYVVNKGDASLVKLIDFISKEGETNE